MADVNRFQRRLEELHLHDDPKAKQLLQRLTYAEQIGNEAAAQRAKTRLNIYIQKHQEYPFKESTPNVGHTDNHIRLGETLHRNQVYAIEEDDLSKHFLGVGKTGSGKTTAINNVLLQLSVPWWAFDRKQDYRHLINKRDDILVIPWTRLRFNPLKPPEGVGLVRWTMVLSEIFSHATDLLSGSKNYILNHVLELYKQYNLFRERSEPYPSLFELRELMEADKVNYVRKTSNYRDTVLNRVDPMTQVTGPIFDCSKGYNIEELMQRNVVFEFGGLNRDIQNFIQEILFAYLYEYLFHNQSRTGGLQLVLVMDEAKQIFSYKKEQSDAAGIPEIDDLTARAREFGLGLIVSDQEATKLTDSIKANTDTKLLLPTGDHRQFKSIAESMNLSQLQRNYSQSLKVGQAIVQHGFHEPVPVELDYVDVEKDVTNEDLKQHQEEKWDELDCTFRAQPSLIDTAPESGEENENLEEFF